MANGALSGAITGAVVTGGGALVSSVATGGLGAGATYIANNTQVATKFADNTGGTNIDPTVIGKVAYAATKVPGADFTTVWSQASAAFCNQASGVVNAFVSNSAYRGVDSIFWSVEMPTLLNNNRVTEIIIHIFE